MKALILKFLTAYSNHRFIFLLLLSFFYTASGQEVTIALYYHRPLEQVVFTATSGSYEIVAGDTGKRILQQGEMVYLSAVDSLIVLYRPERETVQSDSILLRSVPEDNDNSRFRLQAVTPALPANEYPGSLVLKAGNGILLPVNHADRETYIAAVTEAEGGGMAPAAYVQAQAILVRTFLASAGERHAGEGFDLCDGVHCQVYHGIGTYHSRILEITRTTTGKILRNSNGNPARIAYHSNSGGETADARDVWLIPLPTLKPVRDPYSLQGPHAVWKRKFPLATWRKVLADLGMTDVENLPANAFNFRQDHRTRVYLPARDGIPFRLLREKLDLPSAFFSVTVKDNKVILDGRGYGHGLGLSQEGAMEMARQGFTAEEILEFYFQK
ncbi:MAG: SpoIID/LytB domain-containing protein [Chlorobi bacterium]|nr:SpoIID/LytB domain-containing protein [Chlorobiota bacterium]